MSYTYTDSYIERDLEKSGGNRIVTKILDETLDLSGVIYTDRKSRFILAADIVPDQNRVFEKLQVYLDNELLKKGSYKIRKRKDGVKVVTIKFILNPSTFKEALHRIELIWFYTDSDTKRPDIFNSVIKVYFPVITELSTDEAEEVVESSDESTVEDEEILCDCECENCTCCSSTDEEDEGSSSSEEETSDSEEVSVSYLTYSVTHPSNGVSELSAEYTLQGNDFFRRLAKVILNIESLALDTLDIISLDVAEIINYKTNPIVEYSNYTQRSSSLPLQISSDIHVDFDSLAVEEKKYVITWRTLQGVYTEEFYVNTKTIGYSDDFITPLPIQLDASKYTGYNLSRVNRNIFFDEDDDTFKIYYKADSELAGAESLYFYIRQPSALSVESVDVVLTLNQNTIELTEEEDSDEAGIIYRYSADITSDSVDDLGCTITVTRSEEVYLTYYVSFTELF